MQVTIIDTRPQWMIREDAVMTCLYQCDMFNRCKTRMGSECKVLGGHVIPKIREVKNYEHTNQS